METDVFTILGFGPSGYGMQFLIGMRNTVSVAALSYLSALVLGSLIGAIAALNRWWSKVFWRFYRSIFMGVPSLVVILFVFFGTPYIVSRQLSVNAELSPLMAGVVGLALVYAAYIGEVVRGAILNVPIGQFEVCRALGLRIVPTWVKVIVPQVSGLARPGLMNNWIVLLKDTALVSIIGLPDVVRVGQVTGSITNRLLLFLSVAGVFYVGVAGSSVALVDAIAARRTHPAAGGSGCDSVP
jgi:His/Glu/Gln/Arg/opine family amino acid ABC transporter permease subunit